MTLLELMKAAAATYHFRPLGPVEDPERYRQELIAHVRQRDYAVAHELRVGRRQAEWTEEDVRTFRDWMFASPGPRTEALPMLAQPMIKTGHFTVAPTFDMLVAMGDRMMDFFVRSRQHDPTLQFMPMIELILLDGETLATQVNRGDRIALLKTLAQHLPLYGYVIGFDAFMHLVTDGTHGPQKAEKHDAFMIHLGTRDERRSKIQPYRVDDGRVIIEPPRPDIDFRQTGTVGNDPYAGIFISTPPATTTQ